MRIALILCLLASPAFGECRTDLLSVMSWSIAPLTETNNRLTVKVRYDGKKPIRMIDASVRFKDALGDKIGAYTLAKDLKLQPADEYEDTGQWGPNTFERLLDMNPADVQVSTCVNGVVYDTGEVEKF